MTPGGGNVVCLWQETKAQEKNQDRKKGKKSRRKFDKAFLFDMKHIE